MTCPVQFALIVRAAEERLLLDASGVTRYRVLGYHTRDDSRWIVVDTWRLPSSKVAEYFTECMALKDARTRA